jgi:hypothetical protein
MYLSKKKRWYSNHCLHCVTVLLEIEELALTAASNGMDIIKYCDFLQTCKVMEQKGQIFQKNVTYERPK